MQTSAWIIGAAGVLCTAGCGHGPRSVTDSDPAGKVPAIQRAVRQHDRRVIPQLVHDLDSDDPAIRFYVIGALRDLTGQDQGYRYYEDEDRRKPAVQRWHEWLAKQPRP